MSDQRDGGHGRKRCLIFNANIGMDMISVMVVNENANGAVGCLSVEIMSGIT